MPVISRFTFSAIVMYELVWAAVAVTALIIAMTVGAATTSFWPSAPVRSNEAR